MIDSTYLWGIIVIVCLFLFLAFEIPAILPHRHWTTLSEQVWRLGPWRWVIEAFLILLFLHFGFHTKLFLAWG